MNANILDYKCPFILNRNFLLTEKYKEQDEEEQRLRMDLLGVCGIMRCYSSIYLHCYSLLVCQSKRSRAKKQQSSHGVLQT